MTSSDHPSDHDRPRGMLLVGHGTRDPGGTAQFFQLAELLQKRVAPMPVAPALLEFQSPTIPEAWASLVSQGIHHIHVAPLLLFAAGHAKQDIPEIIAQCQADHAGITADQSRPISRHAALVGLACDRVQQGMEGVSAHPERTALVMVGRGSHDPCAQADMKLLSQVVNQRIDVAQTLTSFYAMAEPRLPAILEQAAASGRFDTILVQPHLLFEGRLYQAIRNQVSEAAQRHPGVQFETTAYLGPKDSIAEAIADRALKPPRLSVVWSTERPG